MTTEPEQKSAKVWPNGEMPVRLADRRGGRNAKGNQYTQATAKRLAAEAAQAQEKGEQ